MMIGVYWLIGILGFIAISSMAVAFFYYAEYQAAVSRARWVSQKVSSEARYWKETSINMEDNMQKLNRAIVEKDAELEQLRATLELYEVIK